MACWGTGPTEKQAGTFHPQLPTGLDLDARVIPTSRCSTPPPSTWIRPFQKSKVQPPPSQRVGCWTFSERPNLSTLPLSSIRQNPNPRPPHHRKPRRKLCGVTSAVTSLLPSTCWPFTLRRSTLQPSRSTLPSARLAEHGPGGAVFKVGTGECIGRTRHGRMQRQATTLVDGCRSLVF